MRRQVGDDLSCSHRVSKEALYTASRLFLAQVSNGNGARGTLSRYYAEAAKNGDKTGK
jgi:hypothetical protein